MDNCKLAGLALAGQVNFQGDAVDHAQNDGYLGLRQIEIFKFEGGGGHAGSLPVLNASGNIPGDWFGDVLDGEITCYLK